MAIWAALGLPASSSPKPKQISIHLPCVLIHAPLSYRMTNTGIFNGIWYRHLHAPCLSVGDMHSAAFFFLQVQYAKPSHLVTQNRNLNVDIFLGCLFIWLVTKRNPRSTRSPARSPRQVPLLRGDILAVSSQPLKIAQRDFWCAFYVRIMET